MALSALRWFQRRLHKTVFVSGMVLGLGGCGGDASTTSNAAKETEAPNTSSAAGMEVPSAAPGMENSSQGSVVPNSANPTVGMQNQSTPAQLPASGSDGGQSTTPTGPSSLSEAQKLLDLTSLPLVTGANPPKVRTDAKLSYSITGSSLKDAFAFHKAQLVNAGWKQSPGGGAGRLEMFEKNGFAVTLSTSMLQPGVVTADLKLEELRPR